MCKREREGLPGGGVNGKRRGVEVWEWNSKGSPHETHNHKNYGHLIYKNNKLIKKMHKKNQQNMATKHCPTIVSMWTINTKYNWRKKIVQTIIIWCGSVG